MDAGGSMTGRQTSLDAGPVKTNPLREDASASAELQARLQVNGANTQCGTCAVVLAQAQGGMQPYSYQWSDPSLQGPGPHMVCPNEPTAYSVVITDATPVTVGEFATQAMQVQADGRVDCVADAGTSGEALLGCTASSAGPGASGQTPDGGSDASVTCSEPNDAGVSFDITTGAVGTVTVSTYNEKIFKAGQTYEYSQDRLIPLTLTLGDSIDVDIYGGHSHCDEAQKLFSLKWDIFTWHQSFCFTPTEDFHYIIVAVHLNGALFSWEALSASTLCSGCSDPETMVTAP